MITGSEVFDSDRHLQVGAGMDHLGRRLSLGDLVTCRDVYSQELPWRGIFLSRIRMNLNFNSLHGSLVLGENGPVIITERFWSLTLVQPMKECKG